MNNSYFEQNLINYSTYSFRSPSPLLLLKCLTHFQLHFYKRSTLQYSYNVPNSYYSSVLNSSFFSSSPQREIWTEEYLTSGIFHLISCYVELLFLGKIYTVVFSCLPYYCAAISAHWGGKEGHVPLPPGK